MQNTIEKPMLQALRGGIQETPPIWLMRQAGRYLSEYRAIRARAGSFLNLCYDPPLAAEVTLQPVRRYHLDAAILFSDILVVPDALGQPVSFVEGEGPKLEPVTSVADLKTLSIDPLIARLSPVYETVGTVKNELDTATAMIGFAGAPWTVATYMVEGRGGTDFSRIRAFALSNPSGFQALIDLLVDATVLHLAEQVKAGADLVQLFDTWSGILPDDEFDRWVIAPTKAIVNRLHDDYPDLPVIGFPRAAGLRYRRYVEQTGVSAVGLDQTVPLDFAATTLQPLVPVQGNLDPMVLRLGGSALDVSVDRIIDALAGGSFIFNLGHGIHKETPPEHVQQLVSRVRNRKS